MKVNVKGLVFVGFAAAILSGAARAADGDQNIVTSKAYTDATYQAKDSTAKYKVGTQGSWSDITNAVTNGTAATKSVDDNTGAVTIGVDTVSDFTGVNTGDSEAGTNDGKIPTARAIKNYVDSVASTADAAQVKSDADFQLGGSQGSWKTVQAGTYVAAPVAGTGDNTAKIDIDSNMINNGGTIATTTTTANNKLVTEHTVRQELDGKQDITSGQVYKVGYNGGWSNLSAGVSATGPIVATPDTNTGAVAISANTASNFTNVETEAGRTGTEDGYLPTARAVKTYVDAQATSAASDILTDTQSTSDTTHALTNAATTTALNLKQDANTAVTHTANTAAGDSTTPVYIAQDGTATAISVNTDKTFAGVDTTATVGTDDAKLPTSEAVKGYVDTAVSNATGGNAIPAQDPTKCTSTTPCALVTESDGSGNIVLHWRVMAVSSNQSPVAGTIGDATSGS